MHWFIMFLNHYTIRFPAMNWEHNYTRGRHFSRYDKSEASKVMFKFPHQFTPRHLFIGSSRLLSTRQSSQGNLHFKNFDYQATNFYKDNKSGVGVDCGVNTLQGTAIFWNGDFSQSTLAFVMPLQVHCQWSTMSLQCQTLLISPLPNCSKTPKRLFLEPSPSAQVRWPQTWTQGLQAATLSSSLWQDWTTYPI